MARDGVLSPVFCSIEEWLGRNTDAYYAVLAEVGQLCLQWGRYIYDDNTEQAGYRFIWRRPDGSIQPRGPARIPSLADVKLLTDLAQREGWGGHIGP